MKNDFQESKEPNDPLIGDPRMKGQIGRAHV